MTEKEAIILDNVCTERDSLRAEVERLKEELAAAKEGQTEARRLAIASAIAMKTAIARAEAAEAELCDVVRDCGGNAANVDNKRQWIALHFQSHKDRAEAAEGTLEVCLLSICPDAQLPRVPNDRRAYVASVLPTQVSASVRLAEHHKRGKEAAELHAVVLRATLEGLKQKVKIAKGQCGVLGTNWAECEECGAVSQARTEPIPHEKECSVSIIKAALAETPAKSLAKVKARIYRERAAELRGNIEDLVASDFPAYEQYIESVRNEADVLDQRAEKLEKEAE